jgi:hypothetical protein
MDFDKANTPDVCLIYGASQIVQVVENRQKYVRGGADEIKALCVLNEDHERGSLNIVSVK